MCYPIPGWVDGSARYRLLDDLLQPLKGVSRVLKLPFGCTPVAFFTHVTSLKTIDFFLFCGDVGIWYLFVLGLDDLF